MDSFVMLVMIFIAAYVVISVAYGNFLNSYSEPASFVWLNGAQRNERGANKSTEIAVAINRVFVVNKYQTLYE